MGIYTTGFLDKYGVDYGQQFVEKSYVMDRYPELITEYRTAGLWLWGYNYYYRLGVDQTNRSSPTQIHGSTSVWKEISMSSNGGTSIKTDGTLWAWGQASIYGELGENARTNRSSPVQTIAAGTNWKIVKGGSTNRAGIKTDGTLWLWGYNSTGVLGILSPFHRSSPVQTVAGGTNWTQVTMSSSVAAAIKSDGTLWIWGYNTSGQLGDNTVTARSSPIQTIASGTNWKSCSTDGGLTAAIKTDGTLWLWGNNAYGQLGDNTVTYKSSPVQTVAGGNNWKLISSGTQFNAAIKTDGTLWTWGRNHYGQLADNTIINLSSPVQTVAGGTNWKFISSGSTLNAAIKTDGTLWLWGRNNYGQLGDNTTVNKSSPVQTVAGGTNWRSVSAGGTSVMAIRDDSSNRI